MAQLTTTSIIIAGKKIEQFHSFSLSQGIYEHHYFRLSCPANAIDDSKGVVFNASKKLLGKKFSAKIEAVSTKGSMEFNGIITNIEAEKFSGSNGDLIISGYSATKILDSGPHCKTWEKKAVKNIINDVLKHFPQNELNPKVSPRYPNTFAYYVQYKETAWAFINRICSFVGEWLYFDGKSLKVGPLEKTEKVPLVFGNNLTRFSLSLDLKPPSMQVMAYDYLSHQVHTSQPEGIESLAGLKDLSLDARNESMGMYTSNPKQWGNYYITNKKQLDDVVNIQAAMRSAQHVRFNGSSGHPSVALGGSISVNGQNIYSAAEEGFGDYTVVSVNHYTDGQGNYNNDFVAIPASINVPPTNIIADPICETQSAMVTDNHDERGLGRIRVKFHWMNGAEKTPWIRVTSPHGGGGKGMHFIPEVGEEVIIGFEGDSPFNPYVIGTVYHGKANASYSDAGNDVKALQTRSGNKLVMNDKDGSVNLTDKGGADMLFDGAGNANMHAKKVITINGEEQISLICGEASITLFKDGTIVINGKEIFTDGKTSVNMTSGEASGIVIKPSTLQASSNTTTVAGQAELNAGGGKVNIGGGAEVNVSSGKISMN